MELKRIKTKKDYLRSMERFEELFQAKKGSKESDEADVLALLVKDYEDAHFVINTPSSFRAVSPLRDTAQYSSVSSQKGETLLVRDGKKFYKCCSVCFTIFSFHSRKVPSTIFFLASRMSERKNARL